MVFIKVYLYLSHEATDAKKTLTYERGREIASDRNANDHNYLCVCTARTARRSSAPVWSSGGQTNTTMTPVQTTTEKIKLLK